MALDPRLSGQVAARAHHSPAAAMLRRIEPFSAIGQVSGGPLLLASLVALVVVNSPLGPDYERRWDRTIRVSYAAFPVAGAIGALVVPIALFWAFNRGIGTGTGHGWGVVAAMDTAFSLAIVTMFTTRLPPGFWRSRRSTTSSGCW